MKTEEAIEFVKGLVKNDWVYKSYEFEQKMYQVATLLKRGEAFEQMWEELRTSKSKLTPYELEQKYLKEAKQ